MIHLVYVLNSDWYFDLHWKERAVNASKNGFKVTVIVPSVDNKLECQLREDNIDLLSFSMHRTSISLIGELKSIWSLYHLIKKIKPDIIHSVTIKPNLYCSIISRILGLKLVSTYAGLGMLKTSKKIKYRVLRSVIFLAIKIFSDNKRCCALFENQQDLAFFSNLKILDDRKLIRVYGAGVNLEQYSYTTPNNFEGDFTILFASRLLKDKGLSELVEAVFQLNKAGRNICLNVAGIFDLDSPLAYSNDEIIALSEQKKINWLGKRDDIHTCIAESHVVALPTVYGEGVPRILIEACAVGRPIIATSLGGCNDICLDNVTGYTVEPYSINSIKSAIVKLIDHPSSVEKFGLNGRELVEGKFSNESVFSQQIRIYNEI